MTEDNTKKVESLFHKIKKILNYQDPTSRVKQPYDLCWKCQKQYPNNSFINEVTSVSININ